MIYYNKQLNSKFWNNDKLNERIQKKLLSIAIDFYESTNLEQPIKDIVLTGSLANYNYNKYSDFDVHIIIDFSKIYGKRDIIKNGIDSYRILWNNAHNITIQGHDVEVYIQDITEKHTASGVYSLLKNKWLIKPKYKKPFIDEKAVDERYKLFKSGIKQLKKASEKELTPVMAKKYYKATYELKKKIHNERKMGLLTNKAEFSIGNIVFKRLRNTGYFGELISLIHKFYDKIYVQ